MGFGLILVKSFSGDAAVLILLLLLLTRRGQLGRRHGPGLSLLK